ncbi:hypothetical protein [Nitrosomonas sp. JL21]|nr:hypothetical protein [Nitrosomonas sp. JL21]MBL8497196.1 hypothetical protein [Nitrosomonas sp.]
MSSDKSRMALKASEIIPSGSGIAVTLRKFRTKKRFMDWESKFGTPAYEK